MLKRVEKGLVLKGIKLRQRRKILNSEWLINDGLHVDEAVKGLCGTKRD